MFIAIVFATAGWALAGYFAYRLARLTTPPKQKLGELWELDAIRRIRPLR